MSIDAAHVPELRRAAEAIAEAVENVQPVDGTIFTGPPYEDGADLRNVTVLSGGVVDRSPCGMGTSAVMAVLDAMGLIDGSRPFVHEGIIGTRVEGRIARRSTDAGVPVVAVEIAGSAWVTGEHTFVVDDRDPLRAGFRI